MKFWSILRNRDPGEKYGTGELLKKSSDFPSRLKKVITLLVVMFLNISCTFGSVGDAKEEQLILLLKLKEFLDSLPNTVTLELLFHDDESDEDTATFTHISEGEQYEIEILDGSSVQGQTLELWMLPPEENIPDTEVVQTGLRHGAEDDVELDEDSPYADPVVADEEFLFTNFHVPNDEIDQQSLHRTKPYHLEEVPRGTIRKVSLHVYDLGMTARIERISDGETKTVSLNTGPADFNLFMKCTTEVPPNSKTRIRVALVYRELFMDIGESRIVPAIFQSEDESLVVSPYSNQNIYDAVMENVARPETFEEFACVDLEI